MEAARRASMGDAYDDVMAERGDDDPDPFAPCQRLIGHAERGLELARAVKRVLPHVVVAYWDEAKLESCLREVGIAGALGDAQVDRARFETVIEV
jgi:hypothetical protein